MVIIQINMFICTGSEFLPALLTESRQQSSEIRLLQDKVDKVILASFSQIWFCWISSEVVDTRFFHVLAVDWNFKQLYASVLCTVL